jgi:hypothetical protein
MMDGVRIDYGNMDYWLDHCWVSRARSVTAVEAAGLGCDLGAVVPGSRARATRELLERFAAPAGHPAGQTVQFTTFDSRTVGLLRDLERQDWPRHVGRPVRFPDGPTVTFAGIQRFSGRGDWQTTTTNGNTGLLAGFHTDPDLDDYQVDGVPPRRLGICIEGEHALGLAFAPDLEPLYPTPNTHELRAYAWGGGESLSIFFELPEATAYIVPIVKAAHVGAGKQAATMAYGIGHWNTDQFHPLA